MDVFLAVGVNSRHALEAINALRIDAAEPLGVLHLLVLEQPCAKVLLDEVCDGLEISRWADVRPTTVPSDLASGVAALTDSLAGADNDALVLLPASGTDLDALLVVISERAEIAVMKARPTAPVVLDTVLDCGAQHGSHAVAADEALAEWRVLPHVARVDRLDPSHGWANPESATEEVSPDDVRRTVSAMCQRTRRWVDGDVWQADLLPHMVHHGKWHGQRVDRIATELLLISPFMATMSSQQRLAAVEALSAAAWLHDVGQQGGLLDGAYVREYWHVRKFHGVLTCEAIMGAQGADEYALDRPELRFLVAQLCKCHQRAARLDSESPVPPERCGDDCPACDAAQIRREASLASELRHERDLDVDVDSAVALGAILRVADAADIGVHRVNGRWAAKTTAVEQVWRREFAREMLLHQHDLGEKENEKDRALLMRMLVADRWLESDLQALERGESPALGQVAERIRAFDSYLGDQRNHVEKHRLFASSRVVRDREGFSIELLPGPDWREADLDERRERSEQAFDYIWGEYLHSESYFMTGRVPQLTRVIAPDGHEWPRDVVSA